MAKSKISIIVPVYNVEMYLDKCVYSLVNQSLREIEIILVDDGCTDGSPEICDKWAKQDSRIQVIHKCNEGQSVARNVGMTKAEGDYIAFVDSDDYIELNTYETIYNECIARSLDAAYFTYDRVNSRGEVVSTSGVSPTELFIGKEQVRKLILNLVGRRPSEYHLKAYTTSASMSLYKASIIRSNKLLFPNVREIASEDLLFSLLFLPFAENVGCFPYVFYHYLVNEGSTTTTYNDAKYQRMLRCLEEVQNVCDNHFDEKEYMPHFLSQILRIYKIAMRYETIQPISRAEKNQKLREYCRSKWMNIIYNYKESAGYPMRDKIFIFCMKHRVLPFFKLIYKP